MSAEIISNDFKVTAQSLGLFETPIAIGEVVNSEQMLLDLEKSIYGMMSQDPGLKRSNHGSWHSRTDMLEWGGRPAKLLAETAIRMARRMTWFNDASAEDYNWTVRMWANVTPKGGMNELHVHTGNLWAAVLYLRIGNEEAADLPSGGNFYIEDPRFPLNCMHNTAMRLRGVDGTPQQVQTELKLKRGNLLVFPAWLRHGVRLYTGHKDRISVALNIDASAK